MGQSVKLKSLRKCRAFPDLAIYETNSCFHGFFLEIKAEGIKLFKKNGEEYTSDHIREQAEVLKLLREQGYYAEFGIGFDDCKGKIDEYMSL
jgi:hypothetical protein